MSPSLVEIRSVTLEIRRQKRKKKPTAVKYKPFSIAMPCGLITNYEYNTAKNFLAFYFNSSASSWQPRHISQCWKVG